MLEIVIDNKDGTLWDISRLVSGMKIRTSRFGKAGTAEFSIVTDFPIGDAEFKVNTGDIVRIKIEDAKMFYGYVFTIDSSQSSEIKITAYDQMRYLTASDTYVFTKVTATQVIQKIAKDANLSVGSLANTGFVIPKMLEDGQTLLDIIYKALDQTLVSQNQLYVFYDDFGKLALANIKDMLLDVVLGEKSLVYDYKYKRSIDSETYNRIKLVRDNKKTKKRDVYIAQDSSTIAKWGRLQYYRKVEDGMNEAQINQALNNLLELKNREGKSFSIEALGDPRIRAGNSIYIDMPELGMKATKHLINECSHNFEGDSHTMSLELAVY
ncbi:hypothetical protein EBB07_33770 [Paenibacillaceae bacterium]|nr:hypothetical protein EBB07_33770 [Paenibacillaceae bacterium]